VTRTSQTFDGNEEMEQCMGGVTSCFEMSCMYFIVEVANSIRPSLRYCEKLSLIEKGLMEIDITIDSSILFRFYWLETKNGAFTKPSLNSKSMAMNFWRFAEQGLLETLSPSIPVSASYFDSG